MHQRHDRILIAMVVVVWTIALVLGGSYLVSAREVSGTTPPTTTLRKTLTIAAGGDVIGDRDVATFIDENGGDAVLAGVAQLLRESQLAFVNLESPLSNKGARTTAKDVTFRGRPALVQGLHTAGIDVVSLANNHALDWGPKALLDTVARLDAAGIAHAGAGGDLDAARAPALLVFDHYSRPTGETVVLTRHPQGGHRHRGARHLAPALRVQRRPGPAVETHRRPSGL